MSQRQVYLGLKAEIGISRRLRLVARRFGGDKDLGQRFGVSRL